MHKNAGGRHRRPLAQPVICGLKGLRERAKLSDAVGYKASEAPRGSRGVTRDIDRDRLL